MEEEEKRLRPPEVPAGVIPPTLPQAGKPSWAERISSGGAHPSLDGTLECQMRCGAFEPCGTAPSLMRFWALAVCGTVARNLQPWSLELCCTVPWLLRFGRWRRAVQCPKSCSYGVGAVQYSPVLVGQGSKWTYIPITVVVRASACLGILTSMWRITRLDVSCDTYLHVVALLICM